MNVSRLKVLAMPIALFAVASPMLVNCGALKEIASDPSKLAEAAEGCDEFEKGDFAGLKVDAKMKGLLEASSKFDKLALTMEGGLIESCAGLGKSLGMKEEELKAKAKGGEGAEKVCGAVADKLDSFMKANADAKITLVINPPKCGVDVDAMTSCLEACGSPISPAELEVACQGGELSGSCSGKCEGSCSLEAGAECKGACSGSCSGKCEASFSGKCGGNCKGKCDGKDSKGKCAGTCEGSCDAKAEGSCGGTCEGKCDASCEVKASGSCSGTCSGKCDVKLKAPSCSGEFKPPQVSLECQGKCAAETAADIKCVPPTVTVLVNGKANSELERVVLALKKELPKIAEINLGKAKVVAKAGAELGIQMKGSVDAIGKAGVKALTCATVAAEAVASATAGVSLSVDVSIKVNASATGKASASGKASAGAKGG